MGASSHEQGLEHTHITHLQVQTHVVPLATVQQQRHAASVGVDARDGQLRGQLQRADAPLVVHDLDLCGGGVGSRGCNPNTRSMHTTKHVISVKSIPYGRQLAVTQEDGSHTEETATQGRT